MGKKKIPCESPCLIGLENTQNFSGCWNPVSDLGGTTIYRRRAAAPQARQNRQKWSFCVVFYVKSGIFDTFDSRFFKGDALARRGTFFIILLEWCAGGMGQAEAAHAFFKYPRPQTPGPLIPHGVKVYDLAH